MSAFTLDVSGGGSSSAEEEPSQAQLSCCALYLTPACLAPGIVAPR